MAKKYLDYNGLLYFWQKIKSIIPNFTSDLTNDSGFVTTNDDIEWVDVLNGGNGGGGFSELFKVTLTENVSSVEVHLQKAVHFIAVTVVPVDKGNVFEKDGNAAKAYLTIKVGNKNIWLGGNTQGGDSNSGMFYGIAIANSSAYFTIGLWQNGNGYYSAYPFSTPMNIYNGSPIEFKDFEITSSDASAEFKVGTTIEIWGF